MDATCPRRYFLLILVLFAVFGTSEQAVQGCKNCVVMGKKEKAMFRTHSESCMQSSGVSAAEAEALVAGGAGDSPSLRAHVYCIMRKCKLIGKDGKLHKTAVLAKIAARGDDKNVTKVLESCFDQSGKTPEDLAWNLFRCAYDKKAILFEYMPVPDNSEMTRETEHFSSNFQ